MPPWSEEAKLSNISPAAVNDHVCGEERNEKKSKSKYYFQTLNSMGNASVGQSRMSLSPRKRETYNDRRNVCVRLHPAFTWERMSETNMRNENLSLILSSPLPADSPSSSTPLRTDMTHCVVYSCSPSSLPSLPSPVWCWVSWHRCRMYSLKGI